ncbi:RNA ligase family protein [Xanthobacter versatilis]|uniref:RNA ligase family protein n=1 Tax=Xanthobacter autotrophicus (strain ATCC BAA-1158 / Py2) TaxID=78245 RepID=UPI003726D536
MAKPLGHKAYGSIAHLPDSRMGPADHHCHPGQSVICTEKRRDKHDRIIVLEKLDGACCSIANIDGQIVPLIRAGYTADTALYEHLRMFGQWVNSQPDRFDFIAPGSRIVGEWMAMAHGTIYSLLPDDPFIIFDYFDGRVRRPYGDVMGASMLARLKHAPVLSEDGPMSIQAALEALGAEGEFGAEGGPEGVVYRVERKGAVDFLAKYVRPDKIDGKYLPEITGEPAIWHWPESLRAA